MEVNLKYSVRELTGDLRNGSYTLPEGSTVRELIAQSEAEAELILSREVKDSIIFLVSSKPAAWDTELKDGDTVRVLYKLIGG